MSPQEIVCAWKDEDFRLSLSDEQRALIPAHPVGPIELEDADLDQVAGGLVNPNCSCPASTCAVY